MENFKKSYGDQAPDEWEVDPRAKRKPGRPRLSSERKAVFSAYLPLSLLELIDRNISKGNRSQWLERVVRSYFESPTTKQLRSKL